MIEERREIECRGIFIASPVYGPPDERYLDAIICTQMFLGKNGVPYTIATSMNGSLITVARNNLVAAFMVSGCSHMLFIDTDIEFKPQHVTRLLAVDQDMVCGVYVKKQFPPEFNFNVKGHPVTGECNVLPDSGLIEITHAPTGFLMLKRSVIERMIEAYPGLKYRERSAPEERRKFIYALFDCELKDEEYWGEDFVFSNRWRAIGGTIWMDPTIDLVHWGRHGYKGDLSTVFTGKAPNADAV